MAASRKSTTIQTQATEVHDECYQLKDIRAEVLVKADDIEVGDKPTPRHQSTSTQNSVITCFHKTIQLILVGSSQKLALSKDLYINAPCEDY